MSTLAFFRKRGALEEAATTALSFVTFMIAVASYDDDSASIARAADGADDDDEVADTSLPCGVEKGIQMYHIPYLSKTEAKIHILKINTHKKI